MKIGCDIVHIPRFKKILARTPAMRQRIFLPQEERGASIEKLAGVFAAKEAVIKALGVPPGRWQEINISYDKTGRPQVLGGLASKYEGDLSIAHDGDYVVAFVVFS